MIKPATTFFYKGSLYAITMEGIICGVDPSTAGADLDEALEAYEQYLRVKEGE